MVDGLSLPHGRNLRIGRVSEPNRPYVITAVTAGRQPLFADWRWGRIVVHALRGERERAETLAFVVMPDHLHWLLRLEDGATLDKVVGSVKSVSAHRLNRAFERRGPVWQAGYHDHAVRTDEDLVAVARYVVANPLRAGLVQRLGDYVLWDAIWA